MAYRANVKDTDQSFIEDKTFSSGIPVFVDATTLTNVDGTRIVKAAGGGANKNSGGVVMPATSSGSIKDFGDQPGKILAASGKPAL